MQCIKRGENGASLSQHQETSLVDVHESWKGRARKVLRENPAVSGSVAVLEASTS